MTLVEKQDIVETLRTDYPVRQICGTLGFKRGSLSYQSKKDPCEAVLLQEIEKLSACYPRYDYRSITKLLLRPGYTQKRPHSALGYLTPIEFEQKTCLNYN